MRTVSKLIVSILFLSVLLSCANDHENSTIKRDLKVMIQVDFEGVTGVVNFDEIYPGHIHFERNCSILTREINAAVEGAFEAGASQVIVRDGHSGNINVDVSLLDPRAQLTRGRVPGTPHTMVLGIDSSFDALVFIGAHSGAGMNHSVLAHTMSLKILDLQINGEHIFEPAFNALYAGKFGVPPVFISGDNYTCKEAVRVFGVIDTVVTKYSYGYNCARSKSPEVVYVQIKKGVKSALLNLDKFNIFKLESPYIMSVRVKDDNELGYKDFAYTSDSLDVVMKKFWEKL